MSENHINRMQCNLYYNFWPLTAACHWFSQFWGAAGQLIVYNSGHANNSMTGSYKRGKHRIELRLKLFVYVEVVWMAGGVFSCCCWVLASQDRVHNFFSYGTLAVAVFHFLLTRFMGSACKTQRSWVSHGSRCLKEESEAMGIMQIPFLHCTCDFGLIPRWRSYQKILSHRIWTHNKSVVPPLSWVIVQKDEIGCKIIYSLSFINRIILYRIVLKFDTFQFLPMTKETVFQLQSYQIHKSITLLNGICWP